MMVAPTAAGSGWIRRLGIAALGMIVGIAWVPVTAQAAVDEQPAESWGVQGCPRRVRDDCPRVWAIAATRDRIYVGGEFTEAVWPAGDRVVPRSNLMAIDAATGQLIEGFAPNPGRAGDRRNGVVRSLAVSPDGKRLFVGGDFDSIGGAARRNLAALDPATGAAQADWQADASGRVNALAVGNGRLYAGGGFTSLTDATGQRWERSHVAALNPDTGAADPDFTMSVSGGVSSLLVFADRTRLFVGGDYSAVNGRGRTNLAAVDALTGALDDAFTPKGVESVFAVAGDTERVYAAQGGGGGRMAAFDPRTGDRLWTVSDDGDFQAIAVLGGVVYGGGHFEGTAGNAKLVAADARTGKVDPFNPVVNSGGGVWSLYSFGRDLYLGGDFTLVSGAPQRHFARLPGPPIPPAAPVLAGVVAGNQLATLSWEAPLEDGGSPVTGYVVTPYRDGVAEAAWRAPAADTTLTVTGLRNGSAYRFTVAAENALGTGEATGTAADAVPRTVPAAPPSVIAVPTADGVRITWAASPDDGGSPLSGYVVVAQRDGGAGAPWAVPAGVTELMLSDLDKGTPYRFTVAAENAVGTGSGSAPSAEAIYRTPPGRPIAPVAAAGDGAVTVSWESIDDGGSPLTGSVVTPYRDGVAEAPHAFPPGTTAATVTGLTNGAPYSFTVAAANGLGTGPVSGSTGAVTPRSGYWMTDAAGRVYAFGDRAVHEPNGGGPPAGTTADLEPTPTLEGYWTVTAAGVVSAYGDAVHRGDLPAGRLAAGEAVTSLSASRSGAGYWLFTSAGRVFPFGDAHHAGDLAGRRLNGRVLDSVATPTGRGYYMVAADGGIFAFGDAVFSGSMGGRHLAAPVESLVPDGDGAGYWLVAADGGVFAFDAPFRGSMGGVQLNQPITGMVRNGNGYLMIAGDGGAFNFSDRPFHGSLGATPPARAIVAIAASR